MKFINPSQVDECGFRLDYYDDSRLHINSKYSKASCWKSKQLAFGFNANPEITLSPTTECSIRMYPNCADDPFLYVAPEVSLPRNTIRNSGYKIVRDKEKAVCTVVPEFKVVYEYKYNFCIINKETNQVYFYRYDGNDDKVFDEEKAKSIIEIAFKRKFGEQDKSNFTFLNNANLSIRTAYSINPCGEYEGMWDSANSRVSYCFEKDLKLRPSLEVNPELFAVWSKCGDTDIVASAVLQCDYQNYPLTIATFLKNNYPYIHCSSNKALNKVLKEIGYHDLIKRNTSSITVSPEDWNMLQKCQLYALGLPETGGFVKSDVNVPDVLAHRTCVKPTYIDAPASFDSLKAMVKM